MSAKYAAAFGISIEHAASKAIERWMAVDGISNMETLRERKRQERQKTVTARKVSNKKPGSARSTSRPVLVMQPSADVSSTQVPPICELVAQLG